MRSIKVTINYFSIVFFLFTAILTLFSPVSSNAFDPLTCPLNINNFNNDRTLNFSQNLEIDNALEEKGYTRNLSNKSDVVLYFRSFTKNVFPFLLRYSISAHLNFKSLPEEHDEDPQYCPLLGTAESTIHRPTELYNQFLVKYSTQLAVAAVKDLPSCSEIINTINTRLENAKNNSSKSCKQQFHNAAR